MMTPAATDTRRRLFCNSRWTPIWCANATVQRSTSQLSEHGLLIANATSHTILRLSAVLRPYGAIRLERRLFHLARKCILATDPEQGAPALTRACAPRQERPHMAVGPTSARTLPAAPPRTRVTRGPGVIRAQGTSARPDGKDSVMTQAQPASTRGLAFGAAGIIGRPHRPAAAFGLRQHRGCRA